MKYYKVVFPSSNGKMVSCTIDDGDGLEVEYIKNEFVSAPDFTLKHGYGLLCFNNLEDAVWFDSSRNWGLNQIWECKIENKLKLPAMERDSYPNIEHFKNGTFKNYDGTWPGGTIMAEKIKLVRRVK